MPLLNSPYEHGRLDVTHLGMWLNLDNVRTRSDEALWPLMAQAVNYEVGDEHRSYIEGAADEDVRAAILGLFTAVAHESRHFHDMLLTPYGAVVMSHHARQAVTLLSSMGSLMSNETMIVPITEWSTLLPVLKHLDPNLKRPSPKIENLIAVLKETENDLRALDRGIRHPDASVTATQILETSALWIQVGLAGRTFGGIDGSNLLLKMIRDSPSETRYLGAMKYIQARLGYLPLAAIQFLLLAALCGDVFNSDPRALRSPADVLIELTESLAAHPDFPRPRPGTGGEFTEEFNRVYRLTQEFFDRTWNGDVAGMMMAAMDRTYANVEEWERRIAGKDNGSWTYKMLENAVAVYRGFAEVGGRLIANFSMNPTWYFADGYLDVLPSLPRPVMFFWSDFGFAATPELREDFAISQEIVFPLADLRSNPEVANIYDTLANRAHDDGVALRVAMVISPKISTRAVPEKGVFTFIMEDIDIEAWQRYFDSFVPTFKMLTAGPDDEVLPGGLMVEPLQVLGLHGTRFYSRAGLLPEPLPFLDAPRPADTRPD